MTHPSNAREDAVEIAIAAAGSGDGSQFREAVRTLHALGWDGLEQPITERFIDQLQRVLGNEPPVAHIVALSKPLFDQTSQVLGGTVYDLEFLIRGYAGASILLEAVPLEAALVMQLAICGALPTLTDVDLSAPVWDGVQDTV